MKRYLVGGAVRDFLLKKTVKDKDYVVIGATEEDLLKIGFQKLSKKDVAVFIDPVSKEEFALARREDKYDIRKKIINFSFNDVSLVEDLYRRDFTVNALAMDEPNQSIIDPFGGQLDLLNKNLRHVSERFEEDPLRILRGYRFSVSYGFTIASETKELFKKMIERGDLDYIQNGRMYLELKKMHDKVYEFLLALHQDNFLNIVFPGAKLTEKLISNPEEALLSMYSNSPLKESDKNLFIHYGFEKKFVERVFILSQKEDLFTDLVKKLKIDTHPQVLKEVLFYYSEDKIFCLKINSLYNELKSTDNSDLVAQFQGKALGDKILNRKREIFDKIF